MLNNDHTLQSIAHEQSPNLKLIHETKFGQVIFMKISFNNSPKIELNTDFHDLAKNAKGGKTVSNTIFGVQFQHV